MPALKVDGEGVDRHASGSNNEKDDISVLASKVLADLDEFFDDMDVTTEEVEHEDESGIGLSLDELRLIVDASIRRHEPQQRKKEDPPALARAHLPMKTTSVKTSLPESVASPLRALRELLESKRQRFHEDIKENQVPHPALSNRAVDRKHSDQYKLPDQPQHQSWTENPTSSLPLSVSSFSRSFTSSFSVETPKFAEISRRRQESASDKQRRHRPSVRDQATMAIEAVDTAVETDKLAPELSEKACATDQFGPSSHDLPLGWTARHSSVEYRRSKSSASSVSSRSSSRSSASPSVSRSSRSSLLSCQSSQSSKKNHKSTKPASLQQEPKAVAADTNHVRCLTAESQTTDPPKQASEELDWELDLSNFNL